MHARSLSKQLMGIAGEAIKANITTLGPLVLPLSEQLLFAGNLLARKVLGKKALKAYLPDFKQAFEHFVIHTGEWGCWCSVRYKFRRMQGGFELHGFYFGSEKCCELAVMEGNLIVTASRHSSIL